MSKKMKDRITISDFYCVECGNKGVPCPRRPGRQKERGHLKKLYCLTCQKETNHAEIRPFGSYNKQDFEEEFKLGRFIEGQRTPLNELQKCEHINCTYNKNRKCWNANQSYSCEYREGEKII